LTGRRAERSARQIIAVRLSLAARTNRPSRLKTTLFSASRPPTSVARKSPDATSHSRALPSLLAVARRKPSGLNETSVTEASNPPAGLAGSLWSDRPVATFQSRALPSLLAVATVFPSGLKRAATTEFV